MAEVPRPGIVQLKYISHDLARPWVAPETIVLDRNFSVTRSQLGALSDKSLRDARPVLQSFSTR